jgi:hypothetical protein
MLRFVLHMDFVLLPGKNAKAILRRPGRQSFGCTASSGWATATNSSIAVTRVRAHNVCVDKRHNSASRCGSKYEQPQSGCLKIRKLKKTIIFETSQRNDLESTGWWL